jgi:hypothetical protein
MLAFYLHVPYVYLHNVVLRHREKFTQEKYKDPVRIVNNVAKIRTLFLPNRGPERSRNILLLRKFVKILDSTPNPVWRNLRNGNEFIFSAH